MGINVLFKGHDKLILGFNALFPPGYYVGAVRPQSAKQTTLKPIPMACSMRTVKTILDLPISPPVSPAKHQVARRFTKSVEKKLGGDDNEKEGGDNKGRERSEGKAKEGGDDNEEEEELVPTLVIKCTPDRKGKRNASNFGEEKSIFSKRRRLDSFQNINPRQKKEPIKLLETTVTAHPNKPFVCTSLSSPPNYNNTSQTREGPSTTSRLEAKSKDITNPSKKNQLRLFDLKEEPFQQNILGSSDSSTFGKHSAVIFFIVEYIRRVKYHYNKDPEVYAQFLDLLHDYRNGKVPANEAFERVKVLFKRTPSLIKSFQRLLPDHIAQRTKDDKEKREKAEAKKREKEKEKQQSIENKPENKLPAHERRSSTLRFKLITKFGKGAGTVDDRRTLSKRNGGDGGGKKKVDQEVSFGSLEVPVFAPIVNGGSACNPSEKGDCGESSRSENQNDVMKKLKEISTSKDIRQNLKIANILN